MFRPARRRASRFRRATGPAANHAANSTPVLAAAHVSKAYGSVAALRGVDFAVSRGEIHALLGANGAGKSTLVKALAGVHEVESGSLYVNGHPLICKVPSDALQAGIATVFQDPALLPDLTVGQNLRLSRTDPTVFKKWLAWFELTQLRFSDLVKELPLEVLRIIDLARAIAGNPHVLLLDEITAALTAEQAERVFAFLAHWKQQDKSAVLITHRLAEVLRICDRATILRDGQNVSQLDTRRTPTANDDAEDLNEHTLVAAMLGSARQIREPSLREPAAAQRQPGPARFEVRQLGFEQSIQNVSFAVHAGEVLGLVALEGQGQELLFDLLAGESRPTAGAIVVEGQVRRFRSPADAVKQGVVLVPGDRQQALLPSLPVHQNLAVSLFNRPAQWLTLPRHEEAAVDKAVSRLAIDIRAASQVRRLSGGNQQKVAIGRWLVAGFKTLLCFDPTRGIDIQTKREIYILLRELAASGAAVLLYTSELAEIPLVCDRVLVMHGGRIVDEQDAATATEATLLTAAHGLEALA